MATVLDIIGMMGQQSSAFPSIDMAAWDFSQATIVDGKISAVADLSGNGYNLSQADAALRPSSGGVFSGSQYLSAPGIPEVSGRKINIIQKVEGWSLGSVFSKSLYGGSTSRYSMYRANNSTVSVITGIKDTSVILQSGFSGVVELEVSGTARKFLINSVLASSDATAALTNNSSELAYVGRYAANSTTTQLLIGTVGRIVVAFDASESDLVMLRSWVNAA